VPHASKAHASDGQKARILLLLKTRFFDKKCDKMQDRASLNRGNADACDILD
jgi:hypothetical protein